MPKPACSDCQRAKKIIAAAKRGAELWGGDPLEWPYSHLAFHDRRRARRRTKKVEGRP